MLEWYVKIGHCPFLTCPSCVVFHSNPVIVVCLTNADGRVSLNMSRNKQARILVQFFYANDQILKKNNIARLENLTAIKVPATIFWAMPSRSDVVG